MSPRYADEWAADDEYRDEHRGEPGFGALGDDEPLTDAEGNPVEQVLEPGDGGGEVHAYPPPHSGEPTPCCGMAIADLPSGDALTRDPDAVTCSYARRGSGDPSVDPAEHEYDEPGTEVERFVGYPEGDGPRQPTADEITAGMRTYAIAVRDESRDHVGHEGEPRFDPETGNVLCGCGDVVPTEPGGKAYEPMRAPENLPGVPMADPVMTELPLLVPTEQYTPADLERMLLETLRRLDMGLALEAQWIEVRGRARDALDKATARARLRVRGGAKDVRDAEVRVACEQQYDDFAEAELRCEVIKASMHSLRSVLSGYQSVGRSVGVLVQAGGGDGGKPFRRDEQGGRR